MKLPPPREIAEQVIRDNGELGLNRAAEVVVADRESVQQLIAEFVQGQRLELNCPCGSKLVWTGDSIAAAIRALDLTGEPK